jgi:hypothetical protein
MDVMPPIFAIVIINTVYADLGETGCFEIYPAVVTPASPTGPPDPVPSLRF